MISCTNCGKEVDPGWKLCPYCGLEINSETGKTPPGGIIDSVVKADNVHVGDQHIYQAPDPSKRKSATETGMLCPICHRLAKNDWFQCPECNRKYICISHQDKRTHTCSECLRKNTEQEVALSGQIGIGTVLSERYKLDEVIGEGGMGTVFRARDLRLERQVAIKCLSGREREDQLGIQRFKQEARSIAGLSHLNIVQVYDVSVDSECPYICMELIAGSTLDILLEENGQYTPAQALPIVKGIGNALSYAHKYRVIHRDIKPGNIMITPDGVVKLMDFGLARVGQSSDLSRTGYGIGTEAYASPEQKRDAKNVDYRTDIYSLGATVYEMLTLDSPQFVRPDRLPPEISNIVLKAMEPSIEQRYFTVDEFVKDFADNLESPTTKPSTQPTDIIGKCQNCGFLNLEDARFCEKCGAGLFENCPACDKEIRIGKEHCPYCGINIDDYKNYREHLEKGKEYLEKNRFGRALKEFKLAVEIKSGEKELTELINQAQSSLDKLESFITEGKKLCEDMEYEQAEKVYRQALELDPRSSEINQLLATLPEKIKERDEQCRKEKIKLLIEQGNQLYNEKQFGPARNLVLKILILDSNNTNALELQEKISLELKKKYKRVFRYALVFVSILIVVIIAGTIIWSMSKSAKEKQVYENALSKGKPEIYLRAYPAGKYSQHVKLFADSLTYNKTLNENTIKGFNDYISKFPNGIFIEQVLKIKDSFGFEQAKEKSTINAYKNYIDSFPNGKYIKMAKEKIFLLDSTLFAIAKDEYTVDALKYYLNEGVKIYRNYDDSAQQLINHIQDSIISYKKLVKAQNIEDSIFKWAMNKQSVEAYDKYLNEYPEGSYKETTLLMRNKLVDSIQAEVQEQEALIPDVYIWSDHKIGTGDVVKGGMTVKVTINRDMSGGRFGYWEGTIKIPAKIPKPFKGSKDHSGWQNYTYAMYGMRVGGIRNIRYPEGTFRSPNGGMEVNPPKIVVVIERIEYNGSH